MILALIGGTMAAAYLIVVIICNVNDYRWYRAEVLRHARFVLLNRRRMERGKKPLFPLARPMMGDIDRDVHKQLIKMGHKGLRSVYLRLNRQRARSL